MSVPAGSHAGCLGGRRGRISISCHGLGAEVAAVFQPAVQPGNLRCGSTKPISTGRRTPSGWKRFSSAHPDGCRDDSRRTIRIPSFSGGADKQGTPGGARDALHQDRFSSRGERWRSSVRARKAAREPQTLSVQSGPAKLSAGPGSPPGRAAGWAWREAGDQDASRPARGDSSSRFHPVRGP